MKSHHILAAILVVSAAVGCKEAPHSHNAREYTAMTLQPTSRQLSSNYSATIRGKQDIDIRPKVSGYITDINVKEGSRVTKGQTMFVIDQTTCESELQTAIANVNVAKAAVAASELTLNSKEQLFNQKIISAYDLQMARTTLERDKAQQSLLSARLLQVSDRYDLLKGTVSLYRALGGGSDQ